MIKYHVLGRVGLGMSYSIAENVLKFALSKSSENAYKPWKSHALHLSKLEKHSYKYCFKNMLGKTISLKNLKRAALRKKCPYSEFFWSAFSRIWTEYRDILRISPNSVRTRENADQNNSEYGHFLRSVFLGIIAIP